MSYDNNGFPLSSNVTRNSDGTYTNADGHTYSVRYTPNPLFVPPVNNSEPNSGSGGSGSPALLLWPSLVEGFFFIAGSYQISATFLHFHPIINIFAGFVGLYLFLIINTYRITAYPYFLLGSLCWMIVIFNAENSHNTIPPNSLLKFFTDPIGVSGNIFNHLKQGKNGWAICMLIYALVTRFFPHLYFRKSIKDLTWSDQLLMYLVWLFIAAVMSLIIGGLMSLHW
jgi:hypothetical protein